MRFPPLLFSRFCNEVECGLRLFARLSADGLKKVLNFNIKIAKMHLQSFPASTGWQITM